MKLFLITQTKNTRYDTYDSAVVIADTALEARDMNPDGSGEKFADVFCSAWVAPEYVSVLYLGEAKEGSVKSVVCASFNAG